jgi:hypothetical protein
LAPARHPHQQLRLNLVAGWFAQLTKRRLRTGTFTSVVDLVDAIDLWAERCMLRTRRRRTLPLVGSERGGAGARTVGVVSVSG